MMRASIHSIVLALTACLFLTGCPSGDGGGGDATMNENGGDIQNDNDNGDAMNENENEGDGGGTETVLDTINFDSDVNVGEDPTSFAIGGGSVGFANGVARTLGILPLYASGVNSWMPNAGGTATIVFTDLDVRSISFYFAHDGDTGATLSALDAEGAQIGDSVESVAAAAFNDPAASFTIDGGGATIASVSIETPDGAVVALDDLSLTVVE